MFEDPSEPKKDWLSGDQAVSSPTYYALLDLTPGSSVREIRQAYREKSKLYHPDTTVLPIAIAKEHFHRLNEAYATLTSPERRLQYDRKIGFSKIPVVQPAPSLGNQYSPWRKSSAYLDARDRPLSPGEVFALFLLGLTLVGCLLLAILVGLSRGELALKAGLPLLDSLHPQPAVSEPIVSTSSAKEARDQKTASSPAQPDPKLNQRSTLFRAHPSYESRLSPLTRNSALQSSVTRH